MTEGVTETPLHGGRINRGMVVRVGDTVRRPRNAGSPLVEALLTHLDEVGYDRSPRFHGIDDQGRQVLDYIDGDVVEWPDWSTDDEANAAALGVLAAQLRELHAATASFTIPEDSEPARPHPVAGTAMVHGDIGYANTVFRNGQAVGFIDWEFAGPSDALYDPAALLFGCTRGPRLGADDADRRVAALLRATEAVADGYRMDAAMRARIPAVAAAGVDAAADFWIERGTSESEMAGMRWRANWFREHADLLVG
jgi:Ser/Thr protein kinase RdoA (MazF antagonist)